MLKFSPANRKLRKLYSVKKLSKYLGNGQKIYSFDLLAGHTCPSANICLSKVVEYHDKETNTERRKIVDGPETTIRCYAASEEVIFPAVYNAHKFNTDNIRKSILPGSGPNATYELIKENLPKNAGIIRIHSSGDFFHKNYFNAWVRVARENPNTLFYGYTKHAVKWLYNLGSDCPRNFVFTVSIGGKQDSLVQALKMRSATIVFSRAEARKLKLEIDEDDSHAALGKKSFSLILHGVQGKGTLASKALEKLRYPNGRKGKRAAGY